MSTQLQAALSDQVKDLYSAENQLIKALSKMAKASASDTLREGFEKHLEETRGHAERVAQAAQMLEIKPGGKKCVAMMGLIEEGAEAIQDHGKGPLRDALLIAGAQRVEHYEIAAYGTARAMAERLGNSELVSLFQQILDEEKATDAKLTEVSEGEVLPAASQLEDDEGDQRGGPRSRGRSGGSDGRKRTPGRSR